MRKFRANGFIKGTSLAEIMAHRFHSRAQLPGRADEARDAALISSFLFYFFFFSNVFFQAFLSLPAVGCSLETKGYPVFERKKYFLRISRASELAYPRYLRMSVDSVFSASTLRTGSESIIFIKFMECRRL